VLVCLTEKIRDLSKLVRDHDVDHALDRDESETDNREELKPTRLCRP